MDLVKMWLFIVAAVVAVVVTLMIDNAWWAGLRKIAFWAALSGGAVFLAIHYLT